jgi:hypothetical protein
VAAQAPAADGTTVLSEDADDATWTASLIKLLVVEQLLVDDEVGDADLATGDLALMERAIEASDDDAMNTLWVRYDGAALVTAAADRLDLDATAPPTEAGQWGESTTSAADGFDQQFGVLAQAPATTGTAAKQGWMCHRHRLSGA